MKAWFQGLMWILTLAALLGLLKVATDHAGLIFLIVIVVGVPALLGAMIMADKEVRERDGL